MIRMQQDFSKEKAMEVLRNLTYLIGDENRILDMNWVMVRMPFDDKIIEFMSEISRKIMKKTEARKFPDVMAFGYWLRKSSLLELKRKFWMDQEDIRVGRGIAFHIAPSNVPVNFAYTLAVGLLTGNANIVRISSKNYPQVEIIYRAIEDALREYPEFSAYLCLVRYDRSREINDILSYLCDIRVIWGGDETINELRKSPIRPRTNEITFADRYSLAIIDSDKYLASNEKQKVAEDFYNDTFYSDQNACTSPRLVIWTGNSIEEAKKVFWQFEYALVEKKYQFQPIIGVNKLTDFCLLAVAEEGVNAVYGNDNRIVRVQVQHLTNNLIEYRGNAGYFFEYDCADFMELKDFCNDNRCQTIGYFCDKEKIRPLLTAGIRGIDRVVPIGRTMEFDLIWDGMDLVEQMTRRIQIVE